MGYGFRFMARPQGLETEKIAKELAAQHAVRIHCRKKAEGRGLSSAVLLGFNLAKYPTLLCMDADLQHEPESVPAVAAPVLEGQAEFAIGSRNVEGGGLGFEWSPVRRLISRGATLLAWFVAPSTDPMSGFFCVSKDVLKRGEGQLNPIGFKIALEIMVRCRCNPIKDVGITFQERNAGESKLSAKTYRLYLEQLISLYMASYGPQILVTVWQTRRELRQPVAAYQMCCSGEGLCATLCAPPLPRLRFLQRTPFIAQQLSGLEREAWICFVLGFLRSTLNSSALLGDFMGGGTDLFAALLAILGIYDVCAMNGGIEIPKKRVNASFSVEYSAVRPFGFKAP
ncbi:unnamed protein product [Effrenium voratum]|nr:unnamed protein product [Effrenium voratum]